MNTEIWKIRKVELINLVTEMVKYVYTYTWYMFGQIPFV